MPQGYFCACQPSFRMMRRLPNAIQHGHICYKIWFCRCLFARIFTCKSVGQFSARASCRQNSLLRCFQKWWFSPCRYGGEKTGRRFPADDDFERLWYTTEIGLVKKFSEDGVTLPRFLHRRLAGNMQSWQEVVLAEFAGVIESCWYSCEVISKVFERGFQKARIWTFK